MKKICPLKQSYKKPNRIKTESNRVGNIKKIIIGLLIAVQLALIIYLHLSFIVASRWLFLINLFSSVITSVYVLSTNKNSLTKAVWIVFLLVCFPFSSLIYWLTDERHFFLKLKSKYKAVFSDAEQFTNKKAFVPPKNKIVKNDCAYFESVGKFALYNDTNLDYFSTGERFFDDVLSQIESSKEFVFLEFFIVQDGILFDRFYNLLCKKVKDGLEVRLIYDDLGCKGALSVRAIKKLKKAGIKIAPFNRFLPFVLARMNYRDHRKIVVVDGVKGYTGGCNLADEYANLKRMNGYWKDVGVKISGSAVDSLTLFFLRQWEFVTGIREDYSIFLNKYEKVSSKSVVVPYVDGFDYEHAVGRGAYENIISSASEFVYIMTPYFVIDDGFSNLLTNKALSGVDVRIILPEIPDKTFVYSVTRNNAEKLLDYGVKVYTMNRSFVHAKVVMSEHSVALGSVNVDLRSFYQQFECGVYTNDKKFLFAVKKDFEESFSNGTKITAESRRRNSLLSRVKAGFMQLFAPFM